MSSAPKIALIFDAHIPWTTGLFYLKAAEALGIRSEHHSIEQSQALKPGSHALYFRIDTGDCSGPDIPESLKPSAFYALDTHLPHSRKHIVRVAKHYDLVFCPHRSEHGLPGAHWLPYAADPYVQPQGLFKGPWDIAAVGNDGGVPRKFILQALRERYVKSFIECAPFTELLSIYSQAKIGFNYSIRNEINLRCFEVMMAGSLLITNPIPEADMQELGLKAGEHYLVFEKPGSIMPLIDDWLARDAERRGMAQAAQNIARERHTFQRRLIQALRVAERELNLSLGLPNLA